MTRSAFAGALLLCTVTAAAADDTVLETDTMAGVAGGFLGAANPIRGVPGGGAPWVLDSGEAELSRDGTLEVEVEGLIIPTLGFNPAPFFRAVVSCLTLDASGGIATVNVTTLNGAEVMIGNPRNGDAKIEAQLTLPEPCVAPIAFVTSPAGSWFAVTGF